jgi:hypothetical protein
MTFHDLDTDSSIGPWLIFDNDDEILEVLKWGNISGPDLDEHHRNMKRWGVGGGTLRLTAKQWNQLKERRVGWPWNGYELLQMKKSGKYPPQRLTMRQEEQFLRNRHKW